MYKVDCTKSAKEKWSFVWNCSESRESTETRDRAIETMQTNHQRRMRRIMRPQTSLPHNLHVDVQILGIEKK